MPSSNLPRNLVLCSDGTCSSIAGTGVFFNRSVVGQLLGLILKDNVRQIVTYDPGLGTVDRWAERFFPVTRVYYEDTSHVAVQRGHRWNPFAAIADAGWGRGLNRNIFQLYDWLVRVKPSTEDKVFLFGFSRGAFTVRALAAFIYRYGVAREPVTWREFAALWDDFAREPNALHSPDPMGVVRAQEERDAFARAQHLKQVHGATDLKIDFLGLWDTVKSYGFIKPIVLPHLRHNPIVKHVSHAIALDEQRGWFDVTTWGSLDLDKLADGAYSRLDEEVKAALRAQSVNEVWFPGVHNKVGGDDRGKPRPNVALTWMLAEASERGLVLNTAGLTRMARAEAERESLRRCDLVPTKYSRMWKWIDQFNRRTIDNSGQWPRLLTGLSGPANRLTHLKARSRDEMITLDPSALTIAHPAIWAARPALMVATPDSTMRKQPMAIRRSLPGPIKLIFLRHARVQKNKPQNNEPAALREGDLDILRQTAERLQQLGLEAHACLHAGTEETRLSIDELSQTQPSASNQRRNLSNVLTPDMPRLGETEFLNEVKLALPDHEGPLVLLAVGDEPKLSRLISQLTGRRYRPLERGEAVCIEALSEAELLTGRGILAWRTPVRAYDEESLRPKIASKMTVTALLAGFNFAALVQLTSGAASECWAKPGFAACKVDDWLHAAAILLFVIGAALFVSALYVYDRLAMPEGFHNESGRSFKELPEQVQRHLEKHYGPVYAHMVHAWQRLFTPGLLLSAIGLLLLVIRTMSWMNGLMCLVGAGAVVAWYRRTTPKLGVD